MKRKTIHAATAAAVMAIGVMSSPSADAAVKMYMKIGDIKGESTDKNHKDWIDVLSWSWGAAQTEGKGDKGRHRGPVVCIRDMAIMKNVDSATPDLIIGTTFVDHYPDATFVVQKVTGEGGVDIMRFRMTDVVLNAYSSAASTGGSDFAENVSLSFQSATGEYIPQDGNGKPGAPIGFDIDASNSRCK